MSNLQWSFQINFQSFRDNFFCKKHLPIMDQFNN